MQHVLMEAHGQALRDRLLADPRLSPCLRAHLRRCGHMCSGAWQRITHIGTHTELVPQCFLLALRKRVALPCSAVGRETRCTVGGLQGAGACKYAVLYGRHPPFQVGRAGKTWVSELEFTYAIHWDHCRNGGYSTAGHDACNELIARMFRAVGYRARVEELKVGRGGPEGKGANQRIDGVARNWAKRDGRVIGWDCTIVATLLEAQGRLGRMAREDDGAARSAEALKRKLKEFACDAKRIFFLPVAIDSNGGMGPAALTLFMEAFHAKRGVATTDRERWDAINEMQSLFAAISAVVQRRNFAILVGNARPLQGGFTPAAAEARLDRADAAELF